jgi:hypothetical protein
MMGSWDLSDGEWVWPQALAHYVQRHWVYLPEEFVDTMRSNDWRVPPNNERLSLGGGQPDYDWSFWTTWARREQKHPWYWLW